MKKILFLLSMGILGFMIFTGCVSPVMSLPTANNPSPGKFAVAPVAPSRNINLGFYTVNNTTTVLFILKNIGSQPIENVSLTASNPTLSPNDFTVTPGSITVVDSSATSSIETLCTLSINHGQIGGSLANNYLDPSVTGSTVHISGMTSNDGVTFNVPVSIDADVTTLVNLADWKYSISADGVTFQDGGINTDTRYSSTPFITMGPTPNISGQATYYGKITNTGNVPIKVLMSYIDNTGGITPVSTWQTLKPGDSYTETNGWYVPLTNVIIDTMGVQADLVSKHPSASFRTGTSLLDEVVRINW